MEQLQGGRWLAVLLQTRSPELSAIVGTQINRSKQRKRVVTESVSRRYGRSSLGRTEDVEQGRQPIFLAQNDERHR